MVENKNMTTQNKNNEIDIIGVLQKVFRHKKTLGIFIGTFAVLGVIISLGSAKSYTANVVLAPETSTAGGMGDISGLASMVGVNIKSSSSDVDAIYPEIYPDVMASSNFIIGLFNVKIKTEDNPNAKTYYDHIKNDKHISFWSYPMILISKSFSKSVANVNDYKINIFNLTKEQDAICNAIRANISCIVDKKTSIITISVKDGSPLVAAVISDTIQSRLQQYITMYRTKKARMDLAYSQKLFEEAKANYTKAQEGYGSYADANTDVILASFKAKRNEMENEMQLRYNMYTQLSQQVQVAKAKVQERTPAFSIIQSASIPLKASNTPRSYIVLGYMIVGLTFDVIWVGLLKDKVSKHKE